MLNLRQKLSSYTFNTLTSNVLQFQNNYGLNYEGPHSLQPFIYICTFMRKISTVKKAITSVIRQIHTISFAKLTLT